MKRVATKHNLYRKIQFHSQIKAISWTEKLRKWNVTVYNKETQQTTELLFDIVYVVCTSIKTFSSKLHSNSNIFYFFISSINGPGALRIPNIPNQFRSFQGPILHSGAWDSSVDLENKIIAVIGSGLIQYQDLQFEYN